jgi:hypothetical protein
MEMAKRAPMVDGPFLGFNANFNVMAAAACVPADYQ